MDDNYNEIDALRKHIVKLESEIAWLRSELTKINKTPCNRCKGMGYVSSLSGNVHTCCDCNGKGMKT